MKKRQRKKLRLGEFRDFGFTVSFKMASSLSDDERMSLLDDFLEMIENNGLQFGGGGHIDWKGLVALDQRGSATEEHRAAVRLWLERHSQLDNIDVSELFDTATEWD